jgi:hypothetical protein
VRKSKPDDSPFFGLKLIPADLTRPPQFAEVDKLIDV